jgi:hypothetical protein
MGREEKYYSQFEFEDKEVRETMITGQQHYNVQIKYLC